jgi:hypothetical protein
MADRDEIAVVIRGFQETTHEMIADCRKRVDTSESRVISLSTELDDSDARVRGLERMLR